MPDLVNISLMEQENENRLTDVYLAGEAIGYMGIPCDFDTYQLHKVDAENWKISTADCNKNMTRPSDRVTATYRRTPQSWESVATYVKVRELQNGGLWILPSES